MGGDGPSRHGPNPFLDLIPAIWFGLKCQMIAVPIVILIWWIVNT